MVRNSSLARAESKCDSSPKPKTSQRWRTLGTPCEECEALVDAVDVLPLGVILVDAAGKVLFTNRSAMDLLARGDGLAHRCDGRLTATRCTEALALKALIERAVRAATDEVREPSGALQLSRRSAAGPLSVIVSPLRRGPEAASAQYPAAIVLCSDPDRDPGTPQGMLERLYGLTPAEAALTLALLSGRTLDGAAEQLSISMNTARTHLKHIFHKTGTNRQSDLLRLVFRSPIALYL